MNRLTDTSPEAERVLLEVYRKMPVGQKWLQLGEMYQDARLLHAVGMRLREPGATRKDIHKAWMIVNLGFMRTEMIREPASEIHMPNLRGVREVIKVLDQL